MKNKAILLLIFLIGGLISSAQTEKGKWYVNGLNVLSFQAGSTKYELMDGSSKTNFTSFSIGPSLNAGAPTTGLSSMPSINYGITNKLYGGIFISTNLINMKDADDSNSSFSMIFLGPSVRYYFLEDKKFMPFGEGKIGIGSYKMGDSNSDKASLSGWYLGTGATYFFTRNIGLDITLGYGDLVEKPKGTGIFDYKMTSSFINCGLGMLISF